MDLRAVQKDGGLGHKSGRGVNGLEVLAGADLASREAVAERFADRSWSGHELDRELAAGYPASAMPA
ncbi:MAG TPA: hypothetical protein VE251_02830, partial [Xanthobacteraceae bacterium]|nr:hypothetical protein [Xanthobacteraceae bacterium]